MDLISSCTMAIFASSLVIFFLFYFLHSSWFRLSAFVNGFFICVVFAFRVLLSSFWLTMINIVFVSMCLCVCRLLGVSCHIQGSPACTMSVGFPQSNDMDVLYLGLSLRRVRSKSSCWWGSCVHRRLGMF